MVEGVHPSSDRAAAVEEGYGGAMPERLFVFIQLEFPWTLGPAEGRYLLRAGVEAEAERVVVLETTAARPSVSSSRGGWLARRGASQASGETAVGPPAPASVATTRVTVIDPVPLSAEKQARAWLEELDRERDVEEAVTVVNRVVHMHRVASADPYVREVSCAQALAIRAGWGIGEQVADGRWLHSRELTRNGNGRRLGRTFGRRSRSDRSAALRPQERLAALLGGRTSALLCEELVLRARLDLSQGRSEHAALELDGALAVALPELRSEERPDLALRIAELEQLHEGVRAQAQAVRERRGEDIDEEVVAHALGRMEAALRARTATGFTVR